MKKQLITLILLGGISSAYAAGVSESERESIIGQLLASKADESEASVADDATLSREAVRAHQEERTGKATRLRELAGLGAATARTSAEGEAATREMARARQASSGTTPTRVGLSEFARRRALFGEPVKLAKKTAIDY